jgi:hypothetical protein
VTVQKPPLHDPVQQSAVVMQAPPSGAQDCPPCRQTPFWQTPGGQQSESAVQTPAPMGRHALAHVKPVGPGRQTWLQQLSQSAHAWPTGKHAAPAFGTHRDTPSLVFTQAALPPLQQFCEAPMPPHTSPSGKQLPTFTQRCTPYASGAPHEPEQQSTLDVHTSSMARQPHIG